MKKIEILTKSRNFGKDRNFYKDRNLKYKIFNKNRNIGVKISISTKKYRSLAKISTKNYNKKFHKFYFDKMSLVVTSNGRRGIHDGIQFGSTIFGNKIVPM